MAKKRVTTDDECTNNAKSPTTKHRQFIEQQLKSAIISKISSIFPEDIASLIIQGATTEVLTLNDSELINFIHNNTHFQSGMTLGTSTVGY